MHHSICYDDDPFSLGDMSFNFSKKSEFVEFLRNMTEQRSWFDESRATWNSWSEPQFIETILNQGLGFTFNMIDLEDLLNFSKASNDFYFKTKKTRNQPTPWRTSADARSGLSVTLKANRFMQENSIICHYNAFIVHSPFQFPDSSNGFEFSYGLSHEVLISVDVIQTDEDLRNVDAKKRKCFFEYEKPLKYFKVYTKENCERECLSEFSYQKCGCVPFYYIRNKTIKVCDIAGVECSWRFKFDAKTICNQCFPECNSITYNLETISARYVGNFNARFERIKNQTNLLTFFYFSILSETTISFKFKDKEFYPLIRYRQLSFENFMSNAGGLMSLLAGASLLSIIEFFYFATLRLVTNFWRTRNQ